jgi:hypothetical protein
MQSVQVDHTGDTRLRFVFDDGVVSFSLAAHATFEDIARTLGELAQQHYSNPLAIDVTFAVPSESFGSPYVLSSKLAHAVSHRGDLVIDTKASE